MNNPKPTRRRRTPDTADSSGRQRDKAWLAQRKREINDALDSLDADEFERMPAWPGRRWVPPASLALQCKSASTARVFGYPVAGQRMN